jgi:hypothetical protein
VRHSNESWPVFRLRKKTPKEASIAKAPLFDYCNVEKFFKDATACLNDRDGAEFVLGIKAAIEPIIHLASQVGGEILPYGDALQMFATLTKDDDC